MQSLSDDYLFVVAIDFGTTYSGYAFSSRDDFKTDPMKINSNQTWNAGSQHHFSLKTPTCLLLNDEDDFVSFGYEAENKYSDIVLDRQQNEYSFFQRFKMQLYKNQNIKSDMLIEDVTGKPVSAMKVFSESIKALKKHLFDTFKERSIQIEDKEIRYILTVPAIWSDAAKQFMRRSANMAGIENNQLSIALEPEAASIYCQYLPIQKLQGADKGFIMSEVGTQYMVVDNGGGTADITVHEKLPNGTLKELCRASGGDCGGTSVDSAFFQIFVKLVGGPLMNLIKKQDPAAYLDIFREFEAIKRTIDPEKNDKVTMTIPRAMLDDKCKAHLGEDFSKVVEQSLYKDQLNIRYDKMRIDAGLLKNLIKETSKKIISLMIDVYKQKNGRRLQIILLVGGFSQCKMLQEEVKAKFPHCRVIVPEDAGLSVLKGAVLFGHRPDYIVSRIVRYTYGVEIEPRFDPKKHDDKRKKVRHEIDRCPNVFKLYVKRGDTVQLGSEITGKHKTLHAFQSSVSFPVFQSTSECPKYTDEEGCTCLGKLKINIPNPSEEMRSLRVNMIFGNTELKISAIDVLSGEECETVLDLI